MQVNFLAYTIGLPILVGLICLFISDKIKVITRLLASITAVIIFAASILIFIRQPLYWPPIHNPTFAVDSLSALAALGVSFFALIVTIYSLGFIERNNGRYFGYVLVALGSSLAVVYANNLIVLAVFWGILAALLYLLVSIDGTLKAAASAKKALIIIGGTDALMIFAIGLIWKMSGSFLIEGTHIELDCPFAYIAYLCIAIAAFAKAGAMPFHSWLPDVAKDGPTSVAAYLPASLDKFLGIYLLAKASLSLFVMNDISNTFLLLIGALTVIVAVAIALIQHDFKRLLGYHAVSQVGYMVLGIGTATPVGIAGGLFHMLNNAIYKSCLFLSAGAVEKRTHTTDLSKLGGLARYMPVTFICFLIASFSISGIPPFNGFVSKWMIYQGIIELGNSKNPMWIIWLVAAMFGGALTIASFMKLLHAVFLGRPSVNLPKNLKEVGLSMLLPIVILAVICIIFGIFAFAIPLSLLILPAVSEESIAYLGTWSPGIATALIIVGILAGLLIYYISIPKKARRVGIFIGGENPDNLDRVTGAEFYDTMKDVGILNYLYKKEDRKSFDIYEVGKRTIAVFTNFLQRLHNGILPTYLVWCLLGLAVIFIILFVG
ncbi:MAG: proton-conducting transporter membrane subunit [Candidatus Omnitrophota bacterium]|nr:proton-conducting transporter membrane subunit [Candidatus Omnitrophota bacterium]